MSCMRLNALKLTFPTPVVREMKKATSLDMALKKELGPSPEA